MFDKKKLIFIGGLFFDQNGDSLCYNAKETEKLYEGSHICIKELIDKIKNDYASATHDSVLKEILIHSKDHESLVLLICKLSCVECDTLTHDEL